jgi:hypothetical protein
MGSFSIPASWEEMPILAADPQLQAALGVRSQAPRQVPARHKSGPTDTEKKFLAWVYRQADRCADYMYPFHRQWYINIAAAMGAQGVQAETIARLMRVKIKQPPHRIRHQTNVIGGSCRRLIGYLARSNPDIEVIPGDLDNPLQLDFGKAARRFVDWQRYYDDYQRKEMAVVEWAVYTGLGVMKAVYDFNGGPRMEASDEDGNPLMDRNTGMPIIGSDGRPVRFTSGLPSTVVVPAFHWMYGIEARSSDEMTWCGEDSWFPFAYIESLYPGAIKKYRIQPEPQFQKNRGYYYRQIAQAIGPSGVYSGLEADNGCDGARFLQVYVAPFQLPANEYGKEMYENGAFAVLCQHNLIHFEPNPFLELQGVNPRLDWNPYTIFPCYTYPGRFVGQGLPENLIPLQDAINFINSRVREAQRTMGQPKWFIPQGSNIPKEKLGPEAGERIVYNAANGPPQAWQPVPMPAYIFNMLERYYQDIELVASQPPMMQGRAQGQIRSGLGVQLLQEQALTEFTPILSYFDRARVRHTRQIILRETQFSEVPRKVQWRGAQGWEQDVFFGKHLSPDFSVQVLPGTSIPRSKALVMSEIDRLVAWGSLQPGMNPNHNELIARSMEYNISPTLPDNEVENLSSARYAIARMVAGEEPPVYPTDNHRIFVNEIIRFMQSRKYRELAERDPSLHERFMYRLGKHRFYMQMQAMGMDVPQPIPPFEDMQQVFPEGIGAVQAAAGGGGGGGAGGGGMGTTSGQMNPGASMNQGGVQDMLQNQQMNASPGGMNGNTR